MAYIQSFASPVLTDIMAAFTMLGEELFLVAIVAYLYLCLDKKTGRFMAAGMLFTIVGGEFIKNSVLRRRPYFDNPGIKCLRAPNGSGDIFDIAVQGYSFPSVHASDAVIMTGSVYPAVRRKWAKALCLILPFLVGFSRIYLGVHYPTDVLAGWLFGLLVLAVVSYVIRSCSNWLVIAIVCALLALPGWFVCCTKDFFSAYGLMIGIFLSFHFDDKLVHFSNIPNSLRSVVRFIVGLAVFLGMNECLKLPFGAEFLDGGSTAAHIVRAARYAIASFAAMGLYPILFRYTDRLFSYFSSFLRVK